MDFSEQIVSALMAYYQQEDWTFEFDGHHNTFLLEAQLECKLASARMITQVTEDTFFTYTVLPVTVDPAHRITVGEFLHRANYGLPRGNFEFDYDDGSIHYKTVFPCPNGTPSEKQLEESISIGLTICDAYGDGIYGLTHDYESPAKTALDGLNIG
ncbi:MAG: YbjN domain-containing protein [Eubacteriales bacterium]